jgi:hypothetical protein
MWIIAITFSISQYTRFPGNDKGPFGPPIRPKGANLYLTIVIMITYVMIASDGLAVPTGPG